ncbi:hypothetical protein RJ640_024931 [Escallonia rubra]|uniref:Uncharacterized protein n=1 Tax=Escallonia rubra TaxID=112253 RepID=A0AA88RXI1_9ASTE|nr:hypothetical protein RJ640_024931 [Escallonia rubra]
MKRKTKKTPRKEEIAEDWCFVCKDGGQLLICDYKQCLKAYHTECVGKDDSFLETGSRWTCSWHSCFMCCRTPKFYCYVCPKAVCRRCIDNADFVHIKGNKGFCTHCLNLALLVEEKKDVDSDGVKVDFKDRETYEGLFREYWEIINEKEGMTVEILRSANARMVMGRNYESDSGSDADEIDEGDEDDINEQKTEHIKKKSKGQHYVMKQKVKATGKEFIGWGSKSLIQFLASIGRDTSKQLSQHDVTSIMNDYIKENKLFHPMKKKKVLCDTGLQSVLGKKTVNKNGIYYLLEAHLAENQDTSEKYELEFNLEDKDDGILVACKRQRKSNTNKLLPIKNIVSEGPRICYASIVPENIKLELLEQPETFESKVNGSFVRVKSDPNDCLQKNAYQLVQVTGIKKCSISENNTETFLQVSDISIDICITALSDDDFSEEECEDLRQKMKGGLLKRPTVVSTFIV